MSELKKNEQSTYRDTFYNACMIRGIASYEEMEKICDNIVSCIPERAFETYGNDAYAAAYANLGVYFGVSDEAWSASMDDPLTPKIRKSVFDVCLSYGIPNGKFMDEIYGIIREFLESRILRDTDVAAALCYLKFYLDNSDDIFERLLATLPYVDDKDSEYYEKFVDLCSAFGITTEAAIHSVLIRVLVHEQQELSAKEHPGMYEIAFTYFDNYLYFYEDH